MALRMTQDSSEKVNRLNMADGMDYQIQNSLIYLFIYFGLESETSSAIDNSNIRFRRIFCPHHPPTRNIYTISALLLLYD